MADKLSAIVYTHGTTGGLIEGGAGDGSDLLLTPDIPVTVSGSAPKGGEPWVTPDFAQLLIDAGKCSPYSVAKPEAAPAEAAPVVAAAPASKPFPMGNAAAFASPANAPSTPPSEG